MANKYNRINVLFAPGETVIVAPSLYAGNRGQVLTVYGVPVDDQTVKVSFAREDEETAVPVIATVTGGVLEVQIPDSVLARQGRNFKLRAFYHIVETDSVTTKYTVIIPVIDEPEMQDEEPSAEQKSEIDELIGALNTGVQKAEMAAKKAEAIQDLDARAETLPAGQAAVVTKETSETGDITLVFGLPRGEAGPAGSTGPRGPQGETGPAGPQGPAYTLTAADKAAIVAEIEADYDNGDTSSYGS